MNPDTLLASLAAIGIGYCPGCLAFFRLDAEGEDGCDHEAHPLTDTERDDLHDAVVRRLLAACPPRHALEPTHEAQAR